MKITKAEYIISAVTKKGYPNSEYPSFMFVGRSNVGKSSFINALTSRKNLAYTSSKPGKTQTLNFYNINDQLLFVDVPGYGYAKQFQEERLNFGHMIEEYLANSLNLKIVFLIIDLRHEPMADDVLMYEYLKHFKINIKVVGTKADKIGTTLIYRQKRLAIEKLKIENPNDLFVISSETGLGINNILNIIEEEVKL